ncbi:hypothetical protein P8452_12479 [Trifolium repens]|nr:hypothetical protein P8452_12479 [Trifolium repens]
MDFSIGGAHKSHDDDINNDERRSSNNRLTYTQSAKLENFMKECGHPDEAQRRQLAEELELQPKQVKYWFSNKRTLLKNQYNKQNNNNLRLENERLQNENLLMKEALKTIKCEPCGGPPFPVEEHKHFKHNMQQVNAEIKQKCEKISRFLTSFTERKISQPISLSHVHGPISIQNYEEERGMVSQLAILAMQELIRLVAYSGIVGLDGLQLVEKFLDSKKWTNLFPIVTKAETTKVLETGSPENREEALLLMKEEMHILSPLVRPREFNIIRYCKQVDPGVWVIITGVSFDSSRPNTLPKSHSWKHPSGCMIREMPNKSCLWDVMACGNPMDEVGHISHGLYPGNCTSIFQTHSENYAMILQESFTSPVGSYVIYAPVDTSSMSAALEGGDSKNIQILPSGFVVCSYTHPNATFEAFNNIGSSSSSSSGGVGRVGAGTLLTLAYQILTCSPNGIDQHQNMEAVATINTLLSTSVLKVRGALMNSNNLE